LGNQRERLSKSHGERQPPGDRKPNIDLTFLQFRWKKATPAQQGQQIAFFHQIHRAIFDPAYRLFGVAGRDRVANRVRPILVGRKPAVSSPMQFGDLVAMLADAGDRRPA